MIVVDASVWTSILLETDLFHPQSHAWFQLYSKSNQEIAAPTLLLAEVSAGLTRRTGDAVAGYESIRFLMALPALHIVSLDQRLARIAAEIAADYRLRGADAVYAALAYSLDVPLVTWDQEQMARVQNVVRSGAPGTLS